MNQQENFYNSEPNEQNNKEIINDSSVSSNTEPIEEIQSNEVRQNQSSNDKEEIVSNQSKAVDESAKNETTNPELNVEKNRKHPAVVLYTSYIVGLLLLITIPRINFNNEWDKIGLQYQEAMKISDPSTRSQEMTRLLNQMLVVNQKYPNHSRLMLNTSYMYYNLGMLDSAIELSKRALQKGGGGTVNQIEPQAYDIILKATIQKANIQFANKDTTAALNTFKYSNSFINHPFLNKTIGAFYANYDSPDSAIQYLYRSYSKGSPDSELFYLVGLSYHKKNNIDSALIFLKESLVINPNNQLSKDLMNKIKPQESTTEKGATNAKNN